MHSAYTYNHPGGGEQFHTILQPYLQTPTHAHASTSVHTINKIITITANINIMTEPILVRIKGVRFQRSLERLKKNQVP